MIVFSQSFLWGNNQKALDLAQFSPVVVWGSSGGLLASTAACLVLGADAGACASIGEQAPSGSPSSRAAKGSVGPCKLSLDEQETGLALKLL